MGKRLGRKLLAFLLAFLLTGTAIFHTGFAVYASEGQPEETIENESGIKISGTGGTGAEEKTSLDLEKGLEEEGITGTGSGEAPDGGTDTEPEKVPDTMAEPENITGPESEKGSEGITGLESEKGSEGITGPESEEESEGITGPEPEEESEGIAGPESEEAPEGMDASKPEDTPDGMISPGSGSISDLTAGLDQKLPGDMGVASVPGDTAALMAEVVQVGAAALAAADPVTDPVVKIGEQGYASFQEAVQAAKAGDVITLQENVDLDVDNPNIYGGLIRKSITIELNTYELSSSKEYALYIANASVKIQNGTVKGENLTATVYAQNGTVTIDRAVIENGRTGSSGGAALALKVGYQANGNAFWGSAVVTDSRISAAATGVGVYGKNMENGPISSLVVSNSSINAGSGYGIAGNGAADGTEIILNAGTVVSGGMAGIYHPQQGSLAIGGGVRVSGLVGVQICGGNALIEGGVITSTDPAFKDDPYKDSGDKDGYSQDGAALSVLSRSAYGDVSVAIKGGSFVTNAGNAAVKLYGFGKVDGNWQEISPMPTNATVKIYGGNFSTEVPEEFCGEGFEPVSGSDGGYTVQEIVAATIGAEKYPTLAKAVEAVKGGKAGEIILQRDVSEDIVIETDTKLDLNGHTITGEKESYVVRVTAGNLAISDSQGGGKIVAGKTAPLYVASGSAVLNGGTLEGVYGAAAVGASSVFTVNAGVVSATKYGIYLKEATFVMNGGEVAAKSAAIGSYAGKIQIHEAEGTTTNISSEGYGIVLENLARNNDASTKSSDFVMDGGTVRANFFALSGNNLRSGGSRAVISGGGLECVGESVPAGGYTAVYWPMDGELTIEGNARITGGTAVEVRLGTLTVRDHAQLTGRLEYGESTLGDDRVSGSAFADGSALRVAASLYGGKESQYKNSRKLTVNIIGGIFTSLSNNAINVGNYEKYQPEESEKAEITIDGAILNPAAGMHEVKYLSQNGKIQVVNENGRAVFSSEGHNTVLMVIGKGAVEQEDDQRFGWDAGAWTVAYEWSHAPAGALLPAGVENHKNNRPYTVDNEYTEGYLTPAYDDYGNLVGEYRFLGWDWVDGTLVKDDLIIRGSWVYSATEVAKYNVVYSWTGLPENMTFYDEVGNVVTAARPVSITGLVKNQPYVVDGISPGMTLYTHDANGNANGRYILGAWNDPNGGVMGDRDVEVTAVWGYTALEVPGDDPVTGPDEPPVTPPTPETPTTPPTPEMPETPTTPTTPVTPPTTPTTPVTPTTPTTPVTPPTTPTTPVTPVTPTTPITPVPPITPIESGGNPVPMALPTEESFNEIANIPDEQLPLSDSIEPETEESEAEQDAQEEIKVIEEEDVPLAKGVGGETWALANLLLALFTAGMSLFLLTGYFTGRQRRSRKNRGKIGLFSLIPAVAAAVVFLVTGNLKAHMVFVDKWTLLMLAFAVMNGILTFFVIGKTAESKEKTGR